MIRDRGAGSVRRRALLAGTVSAGAVLAASGLAASSTEAQATQPETTNQYAGEASDTLALASSAALRDSEFVTAREAALVGRSALGHIGSGTVVEVVRGPYGGHLVTVHRGDGAVVTVVQDATHVSRSVRVNFPQSSR